MDPNEFAKENEYISRNIDFTRTGYGLQGIEEIFYEAEGEVTAELVSDNIATIENIRLWDYSPLTSVYRQIQLIRPYYDFKDADVDRYMIGNEYRQVLLAAREVAPEKLAEDAQTWVNRKLYYTHGIGIAMSPVLSSPRKVDQSFSPRTFRLMARSQFLIRICWITLNL